MPSKIERLTRQLAEYEAKSRATRAELQKLRKEQDRQARIAARKERSKAIFAAGTVVEAAGLLSLDRTTLLGLLLEAKGNLQDPQKVASWKRLGEQQDPSQKSTDTGTGATA